MIEITLIQNLSHWEWERFRPTDDNDAQIDNGGINDGDWYPLMGTLMAEILTMDLGIPVEFKEWDIYQMNYFVFTIDKKIVEKMKADGLELEERLNIYLDESYISHQDYLFDKMQDLVDRMYEYERPELLDKITTVYMTIRDHPSTRMFQPKIIVLTEGIRNEKHEFPTDEYNVIDVYQFINDHYDRAMWIIYPGKSPGECVVEAV